MTKKELFKDFLEVHELFKQKNPSSADILTRDFYRAHSKFKESDYTQIFGTFGNFKKQAIKNLKLITPVIEYSRDDIDIKKKWTGQKCFITSIVAGADVDEKAFETIENYCAVNNVQLMLLVMRGHYVSDRFSQSIWEKYSKYFVTEVEFNDNLRAMDFMLTPQQIIPITGLRRFGAKGKSLIVASPKQFLETLPQKQGKFPHYIASTGTICKPNYALNRIGRLAKQDNIIGGIIVEKVDQKRFHFRMVEVDRHGGFQDLDLYYKGKEKPKKVKAEAITIEPHYGVEDEISLQATKEIIKELGVQKVFFHDILDNGSINHHEKNNVIGKYFREDKQKTLEDELNYLGEKLLEWNKEFPKLDIFVVPSNHDDFISKWLTDGEFVKDAYNVRLGCELMVAILDEKNPIEYYLNTRFPKIKNVKFLEHTDSYKIKGVEYNVHGHMGANGSRGSKNVLEKVNPKSSLGHTHAPLILRGVYQGGCNCKLIQNYTKACNGSSWLHANIVQYENGTRQIITIVDGSWRLKEVENGE